MARRALVVDDDAPIRQMLAKVVERQDFAVDTAKDGEEAIDRLDEDGYSLIVLDLMMPRVDGFEVLQHIQDEYPAKLNCTIIASAMPESEVKRRFPKPVYKIHTKPFDMQALLADIRECGAH